MDTGMWARLLLLRAGLRGRDRWDADRIAAHQARALAELRRAAYAGSAFYRRHHAGLFNAPLAELPPVTKADLMDNFDRAVTVPGLRLADVEEHLRAMVAASADPERAWRGRWWAGATSGTTGRRGIFVWDRSEWATVLASYSRADQWAGTLVGLDRPLRVAVVASRNPTHQSAMITACLRSRLVPTLRLDATSPLAETVAALNRFQPRLLSGYPSALKPLAAEQLSGRLTIAPQSVLAGGEVLDAQTAAELRAAWGTTPADFYGATETGGIASPCSRGNSHLYEDLLVVEPVDRSGMPVQPGTVGDRLLVTVLFSRTLPLIRYELSDRISVGGRDCPCGRSFSLLTRIEGREEDILVLRGAAGEHVRVHPNVFHNALDDVAIAGWQVIQEPDGLRVLVAGLSPSAVGAGVEAVRARVVAALAAAGAPGTPVDVRVAPSVERTPLGKAPLVRALRLQA